MKQKLFTLLTLALFFCSGAWASTVSDLVSITSATTFTMDGLNGTSGLVDATLYADSKLLCLGGCGYSTKKGSTEYNETPYKNVYQIKSSRQIALKIGFNAKITIVGNSDSGRKWRLGTTSAGNEIAESAVSTTTLSGIYDGSTEAQVVYINATGDLYLGAIIIEAAPVVTPTFSLSKTTINTLESAQIKLGAMSNMNGVAFDGDVTFSNAGVVTVNAAGVVTPVATGTTTINFNTSAVGGKYTATTGNSLSITVTNPIVSTPTFTVYGNKVVEIACATDGYDKIYYGGSDVKTGTKTEYTGKFIAASSGKIYAYATKAGYTDSELGEQTITLPTVGTISDGKLMTLQPETTPTTDYTYPAAGFVKGGYSMTIADGGSIKNSPMPKYPNNFKIVKSKDITITPPANVTITAIKVIGANNNSTTETKNVQVGDGFSIDGDDALMPKNVFVNDQQVMSEVVVKPTTPTAGAAVVFKLQEESRIYVEVYGTTSATSATINVGKTYTTYIPTYDLDFTSAAELTAYIATGATSSAVTMSPIDKVPAGTPVVLKSTSLSADIAVSVAASTDDVSANKLKIGDGATKIGGSGVWDYILSNGVFYHASNAVLPAGKCYLHLDAEPTSANELTMDFGDGEVTAISEIEKMRNAENETFINLAGQRIAQPTKGLYITNGKKVIVK